MIFFRVIAGTVRIERGLHGARNLPTVLGGESETAEPICAFPYLGEFRLSFEPRGGQMFKHLCTIVHR